MVEESYPPRGEPITVGADSPAQFSALDRALRVPDLPAPGTPCSLLPQLPRVILVHTTDGDCAAHLPADGCGFYLPAVTAVLSSLAQYAA